MSDIDKGKEMLGRLCEAAVSLDEFFLKANINFLSKEGRIFCSGVQKDGSTIKDITNVPAVSLKTAHVALSALESAGVLCKSRNDGDARCIKVNVCYDPIIKSLNMKDFCV